MIMRQQKLLERSGRPAIGEIVQPGVDQGDCVVKLHYAAARLAAILRRAPRSGAGRTLAAPCRNALCAAGAGEREVRLMLQRLGEAEVALLVAFAQIETVRVVALHVGRKFGHFGPGTAGFFFCPRQ